MAKLLEHFERVRLAAAAEVDPTTVLRWQRGDTVKPASRARIERALRRARIDAKPTKSSTTTTADGDRH